MEAGKSKTTNRDASGLVATLPPKKPNEYAYALKVTPGAEVYDLIMVNHVRNQKSLTEYTSRSMV